MKVKEWRPDIEAYNKVVADRDKSEFIYKCLQDKLQSTIDSHGFLEKKILFFLSFLIFINTAIVGYIIKNYDKTVTITDQTMPFYWQISTIFCIFTFIILCLILISKPTNFYFKGNDAENLFNIKYCSINYNKMITSEAVLYKERIDHNENIIRKNVCLFNRFLIIVILCPILFLL